MSDGADKLVNEPPGSIETRDALFWGFVGAWTTYVTHARLVEGMWQTSTRPLRLVRFVREQNTLQMVGDRLLLTSNLVDLLL